jgi:hypothetical protein
VDRKTLNRIAHNLALACVNATADLHPEAAHRVTHRKRTFDRLRWRVE